MINKTPRHIIGLKKYHSGWVAISESNRVVAHGKNFTDIATKVKNKPNITVLPASFNYFGFVTSS